MDLLNQMQHHVSVRDFEATSLSDEVKTKLFQAAQSGSSSNFVQAFTILDIKDRLVRNELADISQSAAYVKKSGGFFVFVADLNRQAQILKANHQSLAPLKNLESFLVATVDTTIAAQNMALMAESMGLGICYIGGIRNNLARVVELLNLPALTVPLFGMTIGIPTVKNGVKPRLPLNQFTAVDQYPRAGFTELKDYDQAVHQYYLHRSSHQKDTTWTQTQATFFAELRRPKVAQFVKKQGFELVK